MAEPSKESDQSMEDILQSIKRIIADEDEPAAAIPGSDVLELTELLAEDAAPPPMPAPTPAPAPAPAVSAQDDIDALFNSPLPAAEPEPEPEPVAAAPEPEPELEPEVFHEPEPTPAPAPAMAAVAAPAQDDHLMSESTLTASLEALKALAHKQEVAPTRGSQHFRSGTTVEDLVMESLKPMLQEWLDGNLPTLVRSLVEREIRRLSGF